MNSSSRPWPTELRLRKDRKMLTVVFDDGESFDLAAEYLRVCSPSAEVQGHSPSERRTVGGKQNVQILELDRNFQLGLFVRARPRSRGKLAPVSRRSGGEEPVPHDADTVAAAGSAMRQI
jgi:hypothetical protein